MEMASCVPGELIPCAFVWHDPGITSCCKSPKVPGDDFLAVRRSDRPPPTCVISITLPRSPVSLSSGNEVPHIFTRKSRLQPGEFLITSAKRLLQQYLPIGDISTAANCSLSEQYGRHFKVERLRSLEIDHQLVLGRRLDRNVSRPLPLKDSVDIASGAPVFVQEIRSAGRESLAGAQDGNLRSRLNHHHAAFEDGGRDEAACLGRGPRICQGDDGVADSQCRPRQRNDGGVIDNLRRPAARSVARCSTSRVRSLAQLPRQLR
jgi:hypothetical protein